MKKTLLLLLASLCVSIAVAAVQEKVPISYMSAFSITANSSDHMDIRFDLPQYSIETAEIGDNAYHRIVLPDAGSTMESGLPELPTLSVNVAIPRQGGVSIEAVNSTFSTLTQFNPYPVQHGEQEESPKSFVINADFYANGSSYPAAAIEYSDPMILRDFRILTIQMNPFSFDPTTGELTVRESIDFRLNFTNETGINELAGELTSISSAFENIYESMILNFGDYRNLMYANTPPRYLIIYGNSTDQNYINALNSYALWKRQKGAIVDMASTASGQAGSTTTTIKNYILSAYNNASTRPDFVILIGDTGGSYTIPTFTQPSGVGDYPYTHLAGSDILGDVFIGRISVENLSQFQVLLAKIYLYERDINLNTAQWLNRMLLVGDWAPSGISTMYISKYIKERALYLNPDYTFTEIYGDSPSPTSMNSAISQGVGFFSYRGYINMSNWSPSDNLTNGFRLPHAVIITCATGNFGSTATTEAFIRLGTVAQPKGAVTAIGMATSSTHTTYNNCLHGGIWAGLLTHNMRTMGEAMLHGKLYMHQIFGVSQPGQVTNFTHWCNLMGDPTMEVYMGIPNYFNITVQDTIPLGLSLLDVAVRDSSNTVVEGASVTITQGNEVISRGYTGPDGNVILMLPQGMTVSACTITIAKHDFKPLQEQIQVENSGTLVPGPIVIDDDNTGPSQGNTNGQIDGSETVEILFGLQNTGTTTISGVSGYVTTTNPYVSFADSLISYQDIPAGQIGFNSAPVVFTMSMNVPHESMLRLHLIITDSLGETYDVSEFIQVFNTKIMYHSYAVTNGGNNALDPGETASFTLTVSNVGTVGVGSVYGRLYSLNDLVSVTDHTALFGDLLQNVQVTPSTDAFELYARPQVLPGMIIPMRLKLYNDLGFEKWLDFTFTVGVVTVHDPLGPDAYGYVIYDYQDTGYAECPVYDWVGIAPAEGGVGTPLAISDAYAGNDEGDQVGADALEVVNLPFPFQFYGQLYSQITVCSNGFLAFGVTANAEFRNYRLPGAMGPNPMIAPFWDDLATHTGGGIYTWFDRNNHAFVIEWYNLKNGYNGSSMETFQVILYDQSIHATSLGDGPIKIQYHTFNNVDTGASGEHGNYSSIGIEDHTGQVGLEFSFNNQYPTAAAPLANQRALFITTVPVYHEAAHVLLGETYVNDPNQNGVCEPGELVELGIQLTNIGNLTTGDITATLSTESQYITMINNVSQYYPIPGEGSGVNRTPFMFSVAPDCPNNTVVSFTLQIVAGETEWTRTFSLRVDASMLAYTSFLINDSDSNYNGVIDPLETVKLVINLSNGSAVAATDIMATLSTSNPDVTITEPIITRPYVDANSIMQFVFELHFTGTTGIGTYVPFQFNVSTTNGLPVSTTLMVPYNMMNIFSDFETENGNFMSETGWAWGTPTQTGVTPYSGTKLWASNLSGNYPNLVSYSLFTPVYALETGSTLSFRHYYGLENNYDGGNVAISTNYGNTWTVLTPAGGYPAGALAGLGGEPGYSGTPGVWQLATFNLSNYANQQVMLRFRLGSDGGTTNIGWFIDNFELTNVNQKSGYLHGVVIPTSNTSPTQVLVKASNFMTTNPLADGSFRLYLPNGTHNVTASLKYHQSSTLNNIQITPANPIQYTEFTLISLPKPEGVAFDVDNDTGLVSLSWNEPYDPVLPVMAYRVYKRFDSGPFELIQKTTSNSYNESILLYGQYKYYVTALYLTTEGTPSDTLAFDYPYTSTPQDNAPGLVTRLNNNYPNPFNPTTTISFDLAKPGKVSLRVFNVRGQEVKMIASGEYGSGKHHIVWDGRDSRNTPVASGVYFYRLETNGYTQTRKMLMMK
jgi:hypothetical protein